MPSTPETLSGTLKRAFAQPVGQALPQEFLAMLVALDRAKSEPGPRR